jgi:hypothetical protein
MKASDKRKCVCDGRFIMNTPAAMYCYDCGGTVDNYTARADECRACGKGINNDDLCDECYEQVRQDYAKMEVKYGTL